MLSIVMLTAITAVALPHLRITTLSAVRALAVAYALVASATLLSQPCPPSGGWGVITPFSEILEFDTISCYFLGFLIIFQMALLATYTSRGLASGATPYTLVILLSIIIFGNFFLIFSNEVISLVISLEIQSFSLYAITGLHRWREGATSASLMYFMLGAFSSGLVLLGISLIFAYTGETELSQLTAYGTLSGSEAYIKTSLVVLISGLFFKITAAPFHYWGPEVYDSVPTEITIIISIFPKFALFSVICRLSPLTEAAQLTPFVYLVVVFSWGVGSVVGLVQSRIKRLLAYSTVSHVGWILAALAAGTAIGFGSFLFYVLQYAINSSFTFFVLICLAAYPGMSPKTFEDESSGVSSGDTKAKVRETDVVLISALNGLYSRSAIFSVALAASLFSAAGIPPIIGFYAKLTVLQALLHASEPLLVVAGVLSSVVSAGFYLSVISAIAFKTRE